MKSKSILDSDWFPPVVIVAFAIFAVVSIGGTFYVCSSAQDDGLRSIYNAWNTSGKNKYHLSFDGFKQLNYDSYVAIQKHVTGEMP